MFTANKAFDGMLNTVGHICFNEYDFVEPDQPDTCGHGFSGAEEYHVNIPFRLLRRHPMAE